MRTAFYTQTGHAAGITDFMPPSRVAGAQLCRRPCSAISRLSTFLDTNDEWIVSRTGMKERRVSHVSATEMATVAAKRALACAGDRKRRMWSYSSAWHGSCSK